MIRQGTIDDLPQLIELGKQLRLESLVWFPEVDEAYLRQTAEVVFSDPSKYCCIVAENGSKIVGYLTGFIGTYEWSPFKFAAQRILYVEPRARSLGIVRGLIRAFERWAEESGAYRKLLGLGNGLNPATVDRLYRLLGYEHVGGQYLRDSWVSKQSLPQ